MPAPVIPFVPQTGDGRPSPGFVPGQRLHGTPTLWPAQGGAQGSFASPAQAAPGTVIPSQQMIAQPQRFGGETMGDFMSMNQIHPGPAAVEGSQPWAGPWVNMNEITTGAPLNTLAQTWAKPQLGNLGEGGSGTWKWALGALAGGALLYYLWR